MSDVLDPIQFKEMGWPQAKFYDKQLDMIYSVRDNNETIVVAGNQLGKDYTAGFIVVWYFLACWECRIVTTSVKDDHLDVLWDEMRRWIESCQIDLPLDVKSREIRKHVGASQISYIKGMVSQKGEGIAGHHAKRSLLVVDEASGSEDVVYEQASGWAKKKLVFGNPNDCQNYFRYSVKGRPGTNDKGGDIKLPGSEHYHRKVIKISGMDSPNVRYAIARMQDGTYPPDPILIKNDEQPWGVFSEKEFIKLKLAWADKAQNA